MGGGASTRRAPVLDNPPPRSLSPSPLLGHVHTSPLPGLGDSIGTSAPPSAPPPAGESADGNIEQAAPPPAPAYSARVLAAIDAIAAVVEFNRISLQESYEAFDTDEDDKLSFSDLQTAVQTLGLEISSDAVYDLYTALDPAGLGYIRSDVWCDTIRASGHAEDVLRARGIKALSFPSPPNELRPAGSLEPQQCAQVQELHTIPAEPAQSVTVGPPESLYFPFSEDDARQSSAPEQAVEDKRGGTYQLEGVDAKQRLVAKAMLADCQIAPDAESTTQQPDCLLSAQCNGGNADSETNQEVADPKSVADECVSAQEWQILNDAKAALEDAQDSIARLAVKSSEDFYAMSGDDIAGSAGTSKVIVARADQAASEACDTIQRRFTKMAGITVRLGIDFSAVGEFGSACRAKFEKDLCQDLANASGVLLPSDFRIKSLSPGSVIAAVKILSTDAGPDPLDVAAELEEQACDLNSPLRSGSITRFVESISQIPIPMIAQVEHTLGTISNEKIEASVRIFAEEDSRLLPTDEPQVLAIPTAPSAHVVAGSCAVAENDASAVAHSPAAMVTRPVPVISNYAAGPDTHSTEEKVQQGIPSQRDLVETAPEMVDTEQRQSVALSHLQLDAGSASIAPGIPSEDTPNHEDRIIVFESDKQIKHDAVTEREAEIEPSRASSNYSATCTGDPESGHQETVSVTNQGPKQNVRHPLRPLPKSSRSKTQVTGPTHEFPTKPEAFCTEAKDASDLQSSALGTHVKATHDDKIPSAEKELLTLRESHEMLLQRVRILEAALQNKPTSVSVIFDHNDLQRQLLPPAGSIALSRGEFVRIRPPGADVTELLEPQIRFVQKLSGDRDAQKTPQLPLLSDEYRSRMSATSTRHEPSLTVQAVHSDSETLGGKASADSTMPAKSTGIIATRRNDWDEEMRRLQRLEVSGRPQSHIAAHGHRQEMGGLSPNSNCNIKTPRSVGSLPSRAPSEVPSLLCNNMEGEENLGEVKQIVAIASEVRKRQEDHREILALRAERHRHASPHRKNPGMDTTKADPPQSNSDSIAELKNPPSNPEVAPAWWEVKDREIDQEGATGKRLLPWERDAACSESVSIPVADASRPGAPKGQEKDAAVKIQALARGNWDRQRVQGIKDACAKPESQSAREFSETNRERIRTRARVLDQAERKKNIQAELVADLLEKGGVGAGSMGMEEQWLINFKKSQKLKPLTLNFDRVNDTPQSTSTCVSQLVENSEGKEGVVELEAVYGCIGCSGKGQCHFVESGEVVFPAARACVILSPDGQEQRIFTGHSQEITCLIVHPNGRLIASASRSRGSVDKVEIILWDSVTLNRFATLYPGHTTGVGHLCFSNHEPSSSTTTKPASDTRGGMVETIPEGLGGPNKKMRAGSPQKSRGLEEGDLSVDWVARGVRKKQDPFLDSWAEGGRYLVSVGNDTFHSLVLWDLVSCSKLCSVYGSRELINAVTFGSRNECVVTCASSYIKFWTLPSLDTNVSAMSSSTPWSQLKGRATLTIRAAGSAEAGSGVLVGSKGTMPLSYEQGQRGVPLTSPSEVVLTSAVLTCSGLVTGSREGMVYLWDEERKETVSGETVKAHNGPVLQLALWGSEGMVSAGQDGSIILWNCGARATFGHMSYGHITQLHRFFVQHSDMAGTVLISSDDPCAPVSGVNSNAAGLRDSIRGVHSVSSRGNEVLVGTRGGLLLVLDASAFHPARQNIVQSVRAAGQAVRAAGIFRAHAAHKQSKMGWAEQLRSAQEAKKIPKQENTDDDWGIHRVASDDSSCTQEAESRQQLPIRARLLANAVGSAALCAHLSGWGLELFFKTLSLSDSGQLTLRKGARGQSMMVLPGCRASCVAFLPTTDRTVEEEEQEKSQIDPVLQKARGLLKTGGFGGDSALPSSPTKSKEIERQREIMRRRNVIAAQGGEFGVFAVGTERGVVMILQECSVSGGNSSTEWSEGVAPQVKLQQAGYQVLCTLKLEELARTQQREGENASNASWKPLPQRSGASCSSGVNGASRLRFGAVTAIVFETRLWDEWRGTCRLAVGTEDGVVLVCEALKEGGGSKLCQATRWSVMILPAPPDSELQDGHQGGRIRTMDWSRCGRYLRACGEESRGAGRSLRTSSTYIKEGLKEDNSWIRVWNVGAGGGVTWGQESATLALAEGGGSQIFLHPLHLALVRTVEWCSGHCLERDSLFDCLLAGRFGASFGNEHSLSKSLSSKLGDDKESAQQARVSTCAARDATGSVMLVGASDGSVSVIKTLRDGSGHVDFQRFNAHSSPLAGVALVGSNHFISWGQRQQFALLWKLA